MEQDDSVSLVPSTSKDIDTYDFEERTIDDMETTILLTPTMQSPITPRPWIPNGSPSLRPMVGMHFKTLEEGVKFYNNYAIENGFNARLYSSRKGKDGRIKYRYIVCARQGYKEDRLKKDEKLKKIVEDYDTTRLQNTEEKKKIDRINVETRVGCKARICLTLASDGGYIVFSFHEGHTHQLATPDGKKFLHVNRNLTIAHKLYIASNSRVNQGPVKSFRMLKEQVQGYENIGASLTDFKNFHRDMKKYIGESDGQMMINILHRKSECESTFYFDYDTDELDHLTKLFWADSICRKNYAIFGDMISFDTTYSTNKYNMIFAPFTGVDHHGRCVTFGAALIAKEDIQSFSWLFTTFLKAMGQCQPRCIITDQDPAMKIAIPMVFDKTVHRFCAWHIMRKVPEKVGVLLCKETDFWKRISKAVWSTDIEPEEFELQWESNLADHGLTKHEWLCHMFDIRSEWVPAYFRDIFMGGLLRTSSRSESENNFFCNFTNANISLVEFYMRFESAMDAQRYTFSYLNNKSNNSALPSKTPVALEIHASRVYTHEILKVFQEEMAGACYFCGFDSMSNDQGICTTTVNDVRNNKTYTVIFIENMQEIACSCKRFERDGLLCRHILFVLKLKRVEKIPNNYIMNRWTKDAPKKPIFDIEGNLLKDCTEINDGRKKLGQLWSKMFSCVNLAKGKEEYVDDLLARLDSFEKDVGDRENVDMRKTSSNNMEMFVGCSVPTEVSILPPNKSINKGSGKRIKSGTEKSIEQQKKKRLCRKCGQYANHDSRNCEESSAS